MSVPPNQAAIESNIRQQNIAQGIALTEEFPELVLKGDLLFVWLRVNGVACPAMLDTGAQFSVISRSVCERTNLSSRIDTSFTTQLSGVGFGKTLGRVHMVDVFFGSTAINVSMDVIDTASDLDHLLIGVNILSALRSIIDLRQRCLVVNGEYIPFIANTEVDRLVHNPGHLKPSPMPFVASSLPVLKPPLPAFLTRLFPRYPQHAVDALFPYGLSEQDAVRLLDVTGGSVEDAVERLVKGV